MKEFDIDHMKNIWKKQPTSQRYSSEEIVKILNHRSQNNVKYIVWISLAEFILIGIFSLFNIWEEDTLVQIIKMLEKLHIRDIQSIQERLEWGYSLLKFVSTVMTGYFAWEFFRKYRQIKIEHNTAQFICQLIAFRKTAHRFIMANILLAFMFVFSFYGLIYTKLEPFQNSSTVYNRLVAVGILSFLFTMLFVWGYYRLLYGTFLRKLNKHLKQLKEIDFL